MRQFVVIGHEAPTTPDFPLEDLPGAAGRLDLLSRSITAAFLRSHGLREDVRFRLVLSDEFTLRFEGSELQGLNPDERSTAARVRSALQQREGAIGHQAVETSPGIYLSRRGVEAALQDAAGEGTLLQLHEDGTPIVEFDTPADPVFVLSDHLDFTEEEQALLDELDAERVSLGPNAIHADHAISVVHNYLDTDGYDRY